MASGPVRFHPSQKGGVRMCFTLLALLVPAFALQGNDAEKLFREMEKKITSAKSLKVSAEITWPETKLLSSLALAGKKARFKMKGKDMGLDVSQDVTSDGNKLRLSAAVLPKKTTKEAAVPKNFHELLSKCTCRAGLADALFLGAIFESGKGDERPDPDKWFHVKDFKLGEPTKVNGRDAKVLHYHFDCKGSDAAQITLWVDAKTLLPLKRVTTFEDKGGPQITEIYTEFTLNPQFDDKTFEQPK
jgi:outer membrane lipoprotein-sorting protein